MVDEMNKWKFQFEKDRKNPTQINDFALKLFLNACDKCTDRAKTLDENATEMCKSCEKLEAASQVVIKANNLLHIEVKNGKPTATCEYLKHVDDRYNERRNEVQAMEHLSLYFLNEFIVTPSRLAFQLRHFVLTMKEVMLGAFWK